MRTSASWPVHPLLFAAYFVLFLYAQNVGEVAASEVVPILLLAVAGAGVGLLLTRLVWRDLRRGAIVVTALVLIFFGYGHAARIATEVSIPGWAQQIGWLGLLVAAFVTAWRIGDRLASVTRGLDVVAGILVVITLVSIVPDQFGSPRAASDVDSPLTVTAGEGQGSPRRDIWYLIFDRYASDDQLQAAFGIDGQLDDWLIDHGFFVARDSQANYVKTSLSLASSLNLAYLDEVATKMGPDSDDHGPIFRMLQDHVLGRFLQSQGYEFVQVGSPYGPTNVNPFADANPRMGSGSDFADTVFDESVIPAVQRRLGLARATPARQRYYDIATHQWNALDALVDDASPKFVFAHFLLPHPPYIFEADGSFIPDERGRTEAEGYAAQLAYTDSKIKALMTRLEALPEERRPIIVLQADEGPYPKRYNADTVDFDWSTSTPEELHMKYGILNAYSLPGLEDPGLYPSITPVNSFRLILDRYFGTDTPILPDREFTSRGKFRPYDFTEITDRLAGP